MQNETKYIIFDTETTGLPLDFRGNMSDTDNWPRIVSISWALYDFSGNLEKRQDFIIKPNGFVIPEKATAVHGISNEKAEAEGHDLETVLSVFIEDIMSECTLVAHNFSFDLNVVGCELYRLKLLESVLPLLQTPRICTMISTTGLFWGKWPKLSELHQYLFKKGFQNAHTSAGDVEALANCFFELKRLGYYC